MNTQSFRKLFILFALLPGLAACAAPSSLSTPAPSAGPTLALASCQLSAPGSAARLAAQCGTLTVYENRAAGNGRQLNLRIAVLPAVSRSPAPDPLFFLAGGPGQAATEAFLQTGDTFDKLNQERDIVLVDQRGTGQSHPLHCPQPESPDLTDFTDAFLTGWLNDCLAQLDADLRFYTTSIAMDDLDQVRAALGYDTLNLYGISYGTRAALTYLRQYPARVRALILDGVVPSDEVLGVEVARDSQHALDLIFERCTAEPACHQAFPKIKAEFGALLERLETQPVKLSLASPVSGEGTELSLSRDSVASVIRFLSYSPETAALLPLLIHNAHSRSDYSLLGAQALLIGGRFDASLSEGMGYSVQCSEDVPFIVETEAQSINAGTYLRNLMTDSLLRTCQTWPRGEIPPDFKDPVRSEVPVLLLSGEADPVTPPANAEQVAQTLPNSLHLVAPGQGHGVIERGCIARIATAFIDQGSVAELETDCVRSIAPMPFFINFSGPTP